MSSQYTSSPNDLTMTVPIRTSIFDLFKIGPGPSSSHTIGPMRAGYDFRQRAGQLQSEALNRAHRLTVHLFGSLSATGKGHGTDRAIVGGLLGWLPDTTDPDALLALLTNPAQTYPVQLGRQTVEISADSLFFERVRYDSPHPNTLTFQLVRQDGVLIHEEEYYSIGGGFILRKGEAPINEPARAIPYPYASMTELKAHLNAHQLSLTALMVANEMAITGQSQAQIDSRLDALVATMHRAVESGLRQSGVLPGKIGLRRKASALFGQAQAMGRQADSFLVFLNAYCLAASEENAAGRIVVTAPTSGASGVIPGLTYLARHHFAYTDVQLRTGMWAAALIGFLVKHNASISGAEMGCMGEIGTASAMGAAFLTAASADRAANHGIDQLEAAAEIGIEHHLGMTCDPIGGYVQIPCIERNAMGAVKAYNAYLLATAGTPSHQKISLDSVIKVMKATGRDMSAKYKETSEGGLALSVTEC